MSCHSDNVQVPLSEAFRGLCEVVHDRKQSSQVEEKERFRISVQDRLRGLDVSRGSQAALHGVSNGPEHGVVGVQVPAGVIGRLAVGGHVAQEARQEDGPLHVAHSRAVPLQSPNQAVSVGPGAGRLHGFLRRWRTAGKQCGVVNANCCFYMVTQKKWVDYATASSDNF